MKRKESLSRATKEWCAIIGLVLLIPLGCIATTKVWEKICEVGETIALYIGIAIYIALGGKD